MTLLFILAVIVCVQSVYIYDESRFASERRFRRHTDQAIQLTK